MDAHAFLRYLKGVILSMVDTQRELLEHRFIHEPWGEECHHTGPERDAASFSVYQDVAFRDLADRLYRELRLRAPARLHRMLNAWRRQQFDTDNIPLQGCHRRLRAELRALAVEVMNEMIGEAPSKRPGFKAKKSQNVRTNSKHE
jgi:hypothetical protein